MSQQEVESGPGVRPDGGPHVVHFTLHVSRPPEGPEGGCQQAADASQQLKKAGGQASLASSSSHPASLGTY